MVPEELEVDTKIDGIYELQSQLTGIDSRAFYTLVLTKTESGLVSLAVLLSVRKTTAIGAVRAEWFCMCRGL
jgi:hypothetical protein